MPAARTGLVLSAVIALSCTTLTAAAGPPVDVTWTAPRNQSSATADAADPQTVMSADGQRIVQVWDLDTDGVQVVRSSDSGTTWSDPVAVPTGASPTIEQLASSRDGMHLMLLVRWFTGAGSGLFVTRSHDGGASWTWPLELSDTGAQSATAAVSDSGQHMVAVWTQSLPGAVRTVARVSLDGGMNWRAREVLSLAGFTATAPDVALSADGLTAVAVWKQTGGGASATVQANRTADGGVTWGSPSALSVDGESPHNPQVVLSTDGVRSASVWTRDAGGGQVRLTKSKSGGQMWEAAQTISAPGFTETAPAITASGNGMVLNLVWQVDAPVYSRIANTCTQDWGSTWLTQQVLSQKNVPATDPMITASSSGHRVTAAWTAETGGTFRIQTVTSVDGCVSWTPHQYLSDAGWDSLLHGLVSSSKGLRVAAAWNRYDGLHDRTQIARATVTTLPGAPENVGATAGDGTATATWSPPSDDGGSAITSYTAIASPGGQTCSSTGPGCTVPGLTNGTAYTISVTATNAMGTGPAATSAAVTPQAGPTPKPDTPTKAKLKAMQKRSKLLVTISPDRGPAVQWTFTVQRKKGKKWRAVGKARTTRGPKHQRLLNLHRGTYRVVVTPVTGFTGSTSKSVRLVR